MAEKGIVFFDCDGVLTEAQSSWMTLHSYFGSRDNRFFADLYRRGIISYEDWMKIDIALMINAWGRSIRRSDVEEALGSIELREDAVEAAARLRSAGYIVGVISSGVDILVKRVCHAIDADICLYNELGFVDDILVPGGRAWVPLKEKPYLIEKIAGSMGYSLGDTVYVGDSGWDKLVFKKVGLSIAIKPCGDACDAASHTAETLLEAVEIILGRNS